MMQFNQNLEEGGAAEEAPEGGEEEEGKVKENQSDISEEEEIKIPPKDLTGIYNILTLKNLIDQLMQYMQLKMTVKWLLRVLIK